MMKKVFWIVVEVLLSAAILATLTSIKQKRDSEEEDPAETSAVVTTATTVDQNVPECENPGVDEGTVPPQVEPAWPEAPGAE